MPLSIDDLSVGDTVLMSNHPFSNLPDGIPVIVKGLSLPYIFLLPDPEVLGFLFPGILLPVSRVTFHSTTPEFVQSIRAACAAHRAALPRQSLSAAQPSHPPSPTTYGLAPSLNLSDGENLPSRDVG
jgi:hypothetical protein